MILAPLRCHGAGLICLLAFGQSPVSVLRGASMALGFHRWLLCCDRFVPKGCGQLTPGSLAGCPELFVLCDQRVDVDHLPTAPFAAGLLISTRLLLRSVMPSISF